MTGSIGVVTINLARLGYLFKQNREALFARLGELLDLAKSCLEKKRAFVQEMYDRGLYPYTKRYLPTFRNHFSTIGVNGMNELLRNFSNDTMDITSEEGRAFAEEILEFIRLRSTRRKPATCTTWKPRPRKAPRTASPAKTRNAILTSSRPAPWGSVITRTAPSFPWTTQATCSGRSSFRMNFNAATREEPSSTCT